MELPSCPSCHQSVLDDEAELCPFCGAPLNKGAAAASKASPARPATASRPAPPAPSAAPPSRTTSPNKPAASQRPGSPSSGKSSAPQDKKSPEKAARSAADEALEESFKVDSSAGLDVPQASRQRSQTRPYKVRCPMCETIGYVPRSSVGKEVRCANRECMVPVFIVPKPEKEKDEEEAPPKKLTAKNLLTGLSAVILIAGAVGFFIKNQPEAIHQNQNPEPAPGINPRVADATKDKANDANAAPPVVEKPLTVSEERDPVLAMMSSAAQDQGHNRSRPLCDRIVAHTAADCGNLELASKFLGPLNNAENGLTFYRVPPLTAIAWWHLKSGDKAAAEKSLEESSKAAADLPGEGVFSIDASAWLAAALTAAGRDKEAPALVARFPSSFAAGRLAAAEARAVAWNSYDIDRADQERPLFDVQSLQLPAVVEISVAKGFPAEALRLAQSIPDESLRAECEISWLEAVERAKLSSVKPVDDQNAAALDAVLSKLKPAAQARSHARFGLLRLRANDRAGAESELKAAVTALGSAQAGAEFELPSLKEIYEWQPSDPGPAHQNAFAYAEIARLRAGLGQVADANRSLSIALDCLRASAPSPSAVDAKERINKTDRAGLRAELRTTLKLRDAQVDAAAAQYGHNLRDVLGPAAEARFALELEILDTALAWADPAELWKLISNRVTAGDVDRMEPFARTALPWQLILRLNSKADNRDEKTLTAIRKAVAGTPPKALAVLDDGISKASEATPSELAQGLKSIEGLERSDQERGGLIIVDRLVSSGQFDKAFKFAREILDPNLKEETMEWCVAYACRLGQGRAVKEHLHAANSSLSSTQKVAAWRGFLIGLLARERAEPATATASPTAAAPAKATPPAAPQPPAGADSKQAEAPKG